jgi:hypothetical protein
MMKTEEYKRLTLIKIDSIVSRDIESAELYLQFKSQK